MAIRFEIHIRLRACRRPSKLSPANFAPPPNFRDALFVVSTRCRSLGGTKGRGQGDPRGIPKGPKGTPKDPRGPKGGRGQGDPRGTPKGPKGTPKDPRVPKGNQGTQRAQRDPRGIKGTQGDPRAPSAPSGGWAHGALWGYSEAIPNGKPFRAEGYYERKPAPK